MTKYVRNEDLSKSDYAKEEYSNLLMKGDVAIDVAVSHLKKILKKRPDACLLDIGCGSGYFLDQVLKRTKVKNIEFCDIIDCLVFDSVKKRSKIRLVNLNEQPMPYKDNSVDFAVCVGVYEHVENPYHLTREAWRVLKKGGILLVKIPSGLNLWERLYFLFTGNVTRWTMDNDHITFYTYDTFEKLFVNNGFKILKAHKTKGTFPFLRFKIPPTKLFNGCLMYSFKKVQK